MAETITRKFAYIAPGEHNAVSRVMPVNLFADENGQPAMLETTLAQLRSDFGPGMIFNDNVPDDVAKTEVEIAYCHGELSF